jgi:hypothetical protein
MITLENGYRFEAEELALSGFRVESSSVADASSGKFIATRHYSGATGNAYGKFAGEPGTYQVEVGYYDENDGKSRATKRSSPSTRTSAQACRPPALIRPKSPIRALP